MDEQTRFRTALAALGAHAEQQNGRLSREDVQAFLQDMNLNEEQYRLVYAYLASRQIRVEGVAFSGTLAEKPPYSEEEQAFLKQYRQEMRRLVKEPENRLAELAARAADGEPQAKRALTEQWMERVLSVAGEYAGQGLPLPDLVQEGSLGLMIGADTLGLREDGRSWEEHLEQEIRRAIRAALDEQAGADSAGEQITGRLNRLADAVTELTEDLGRQVTPEALSLYLDLPLEELEGLLRIAGENIETADGT